MAFFDSPEGREDPSEQPANDPDAGELQSLERIVAGGIPATAQRRLRALGGADSLFTSSFSVGEYALLDDLAARPLAQVMGASVHQVGWQYLPPPLSWQSPPSLAPARGRRLRAAGGALPGRYPASSLYWRSRRSPTAMSWKDTVLCELETIGRAWDQARRRALDRLTEEARLLEADAVVGVNLHRGEHDWASGTVDYLLSGTAVRFGGDRRAAWPVLTDLSVQEYWKLRAAGYDSVGLVATTAVVFVSMAGATRWRRVRSLAQNQELPELTQAIFAARDTARARLLGQARDNHSSGIIGMTFEQSLRGEKFKFAGPGTTGDPHWQLGKARVRGYGTGASDQERRGLVVTFHGAGTAIRRAEMLDPYPPQAITRLSASR